MRDDLLALPPDALIALANRGLFKRAQKDPAPVVDLAADGTLTARFADAVVVTLAPAAAVPQAVCSCPAAGVCRHVLGAVLAYQRAAGPDAGLDAGLDAGPEAAADAGADGAAPTARWSPGRITDEELKAAFGAAALTAARRARNLGFVATVHRAAAPAVELPGCVVRFLVSGDLDYVHTDAAAARRGEMVTLAVWAARAADEQDPDAAQVELELGPATSAAAAGGGLAAACALADTVLEDGARNCAGPLAGALSVARAELVAANLCWPLAALDELSDQLSAYAARHAAYAPRAVATVLAELHARDRAVRNGGTSLRARVLGTEEARETALRRLSLVGLGARVRRGPDGVPAAEVFLADGQGAVLVLRRAAGADEGAEAATGAGLGRRRVGGARLRDLAGGVIVSESARRSASRALRIASSQVARTSVLQSPQRWASLPDALVVRDFAAALAELAALPPRLVRPRVEAEFVRVVEVAAVHGVDYDAGEQRLTALVADAQGATAVVSRAYDSAAPAALDALAEALRADRPMISGALDRTAGRLMIDPLAVVHGETIAVPDFAPGNGDVALEADVVALSRDPLAAALDTALDALADAAHVGVRRLGAGQTARLEAAAARLDGVGLYRAGAAVRAVTGGDPARWVDAQIRMLATAEAR